MNSAPYPQESEGKIKQDLSVFHKIKGSNLFEGACHNKIYCKIHWFFLFIVIINRLSRIRVVPHFSSGIVRRAKRERPCLFSREVIFTRARVSRALLSLRKNGGILVVYRLRPKSDQHQFSPDKFNTLWRQKVMRIYKMMENLLIFYQILSTTSLKKCVEISRKNLYVDLEAWRVK